MKINMKHIDTKQIALDERTTRRTSMVSMGIYASLFAAWLILQLHK